jgi:dynactin complex subunit
MNIAAKGLMYEFVLRNIYPDIEGRMKRIEEDEFYQKLRAKVLQYEKFIKEIGDGKRQPMSIEEFGRYQEIERKFAVMDTRRNKLKESLRLIKKLQQFKKILETLNVPIQLNRP